MLLIIGETGCTAVLFCCDYALSWRVYVVVFLVEKLTRGDLVFFTRRHTIHTQWLKRSKCKMASECNKITCLLRIVAILYAISLVFCLTWASDSNVKGMICWFYFTLFVHMACQCTYSVKCQWTIAMIMCCSFKVKLRLWAWNVSTFRIIICFLTEVTVGIS